MPDLTDEQRDALEKEANSEEFKKFIDAEEAKARELAEHPYMQARTTLDEEFELTITYEKTGVPIGYVDVDETMPIVESVLMEENPGALITNDLYIITITPDVDQVILATEKMNNAFVRTSEEVTRDYIIEEWNRKK